MKVNLPALKFKTTDLSPYLSSETIEYHYFQHHKGYVTKLNNLLLKEDNQYISLEDIIRKTYKKKDKIFNNAAQIWNHNFYWECLSPISLIKDINSNLLSYLNKFFINLENFQDTFIKKCMEHFGSGWVWLIKNNNKLEIINTNNADSVIVKKNVTPLLVCDMWEHAYYIDYRNRKLEYLKNFFKIINWKKISQNFSVN